MQVNIIWIPPAVMFLMQLAVYRNWVVLYAVWLKGMMVINNSVFFDVLFWKVVAITGPTDVWKTNNTGSGEAATE